MTSTVPDPALVLVATPIGNFEDLSARAVRELAHASVVACEDTRRTGLLFQHFAISHAPFIVCNEHTEQRVAAEVVRRIAAGERVALVSDAGTPAVSDPGGLVVGAVLDAGLPVTIVPGASAVLAALAVSGLPTDRFCFEGFLPRKGRERHDRLAALLDEPRTTVIYESPRRIAATLAELASVLGADRRVSVVRELTKTHEEVWRGTTGGATAHFTTNEPRGEFVLVVAGAEPKFLSDEQICMALEIEMRTGSTRRDAVDAVVNGLGAAKRRVYDLALTLDDR